MKDSALINGRGRRTEESFPAAQTSLAFAALRARAAHLASTDHLLSIEEINAEVRKQRGGDRDEQQETHIPGHRRHPGRRAK